MKYIVLLVLLGLIYFFIQKELRVEKQEVKKTAVSNAAAKEGLTKKKITLTAKKKEFINLVLPSVLKVHEELEHRYEKIAKDIKNGTNKSEIDELKVEYKAKNDEDLLAKLKPHPVSIALAQAAMESSWGKSRFAKEANNFFGMWSSKKNEPRIAAGEQRDNNRTIWLKKFNSLDDAVRDYYNTIARVRIYKKLRGLRIRYDDPYKITPGLDKYSEMGQSYVDNVNQVIKYNNLIRYDQLSTHYSKLLQDDTPREQK